MSRSDILFIRSRPVRTRMLAGRVSASLAHSEPASAGTSPAYARRFFVPTTIGPSSTPILAPTLVPIIAVTVARIVRAGCWSSRRGDRGGNVQEDVGETVGCGSAGQRSAPVLVGARCPHFSSNKRSRPNT